MVPKEGRFRARSWFSLRIRVSGGTVEAKGLHRDNHGALSALKLWFTRGDGVGPPFGVPAARAKKVTLAPPGALRSAATWDLEDESCSASTAIRALLRSLRPSSEGGDAAELRPP
jgi:hypothetical protein